jgi:hypothetical protein
MFYFDEMVGGWIRVFSAIFTNIAVISWRSVFSVEEIVVPRENHIVLYPTTI